MQFTLQLVFWAIGVPLSVLVIAELLRGGYKQYPILFLYQIVDLLMTVASLPSYFAFYVEHSPAARIRMGQWFWWDEILLQPLVFAVVISLIFRATERVRSRRMMRVILLSGAIVTAGVSYLVHYNPQMPRGDWMAFWTRDLTFSSAILDLALWALLLSSKRTDPTLLMVSGGLGIQFTGEAIGESLRSMAVQHRSHALSFAGSFVTTIVDLTALYIIWQALRSSKSLDAKRAAV